MNNQDVERIALLSKKAKDMKAKLSAVNKELENRLSGIVNDYDAGIEMPATVEIKGYEKQSSVKWKKIYETKHGKKAVDKINAAAGMDDFLSISVKGFIFQRKINEDK